MAIRYPEENRKRREDQGHQKDKSHAKDNSTYHQDTGEPTL